MADQVCCPLSGDDFSPPEFYSVDTPRARKLYCCYECNEDIVAGAQHERVTGKWDGVVSTHRTCLSCVEIRNHFACGQGWIFGELWSQLAENFFPGMTAGGPCFLGLSPAAKARLFDRRLRWLEDNAS